MDDYRILVTGAGGMIGSRLTDFFLSKGCEVIGADRTPEKEHRKGYTHIQIDLGDKDAMDKALEGHRLTHIVHLAALAHTAGVDDLSWERYLHINVTCAENVFSIAAERNVPILFSSTADVYGITDGVVDGNSARHPIGNYAKSKCLAEDALKKICKDTPYAIMRFAPVYTPEVKRDIQKRYYLKYPNIAYRVGKGVEYEVLSIENLIAAVSNWVEKAEGQQTINVKDKHLMKTADVLKEEKQAGRAKLVIWVPRWCVAAVFKVCRTWRPSGWNTYMLNKIVNPLRTR